MKRVCEVKQKTYRTFFSVMFFCFPLFLFSQENVNINAEYPRFYLTTGTGYNYFNGLLGAQAEYRFLDKVSVNAGAGVCGWGYKASIGTRYYFRYPKGWGLGLGYSTNTGIKDVKIDLETTVPGGMKNVEMELKQTGTINITAHFHWPIKVKHRFNLEFGYAYALDNKPYKLKDQSIVLTEVSEMALWIEQPGGIIFGVSFSFGIF